MSFVTGLGSNVSLQSRKPSLRHVDSSVQKKKVGCCERQHKFCLPSPTPPHSRARLKLREFAWLGGEGAALRKQLQVARSAFPRPGRGAGVGHRGASGSRARREALRNRRLPFSTHL